MLINKAISKGFTLIELLVVITIIGILATGATTIYTSQIQKARDTTRINDVKALQSAIEQVYQDWGVYPVPSKFITGAAAGDVTVKTYMPKIPRDPKNGQACNMWGGAVKSGCVYAYQAGADDNGISLGVYVVSSGFESLGKATSDATRDGGKVAYRLEAGNGFMGSGSLTVTASANTCGDSSIPATATGLYNGACTALISGTAEDANIVTIMGL